MEFLSGLSVKKLSKETPPEKQTNRDETLWKLINDAHPCKYRCNEEGIIYCKILRMINFSTKPLKKSEIDPYKCADCELKEEDLK